MFQFCSFAFFTAILQTFCRAEPNCRENGNAAELYAVPCRIADIIQIATFFWLIAWIWLKSGTFLLISSSPFVAIGLEV